MSHAIDESDDTVYDIPRVQLPQYGPIEKATTMTRFNRRITQHPVWVGAFVGITCFFGTTIVNIYDQRVEQPFVDNMQNYRLDKIEKSIETVKVNQVKHMKVLSRIEAKLK